MKDAKFLHRLDPQEQLTPPGDVWRQRRQQIDSGDRHRRSRDEQREGVGVAKGPEGIRVSM